MNNPENIHTCLNIYAKTKSILIVIDMKQHVEMIPGSREKS